jgi:hypothetical protein
MISMESGPPGVRTAAVRKVVRKVVDTFALLWRFRCCRSTMDG